MAEFYQTEKTFTNYIAANNSKNKITLIALFTRDATVVDEGKHYKGIDAIKNWRKKVNAGYDIIMEIVGGSPAKEEGVLLDILCTGNFPGSPLIRQHHFILKNNLIVYLKMS